MQVEIKGFIIAYFSKYGESSAIPSSYSFMTYVPEGVQWAKVCEHSHIVEFEVQDNWIPQRVEIMRAAQAKARVAAQETVAEIEEELQKLLCLESSV